MFGGHGSTLQRLIFLLIVARWKGLLSSHVTFEKEKDLFIKGKLGHGWNKIIFRIIMGRSRIFLSLA